MITREAFTQWLQSQEGGLTVGRTGHCRACPIARFLESQGYTDVWVNEALAWTGPPSQNRYVKLDPWAARFIEDLDDRYFRSTSVPASECLEVLAGIP